MASSPRVSQNLLPFYFDDHTVRTDWSGFTASKSSMSNVCVVCRSSITTSRDSESHQLFFFCWDGKELQVIGQSYQHPAFVFCLLLLSLSEGKGESRHHCYCSLSMENSWISCERAELLLAFFFFNKVVELIQTKGWLKTFHCYVCIVVK